MEIGTTAQKPNFKIRIIIGLLGALFFVLSLYLMNTYIFDQPESISYYLIQAILFGFLMSSVVPWALQKFGKKAFNKLGKSIDILLGDNENIEYEGPANLFRGIEGVGGKLVFTNQKLIFASHKFNIQKGQTDIYYDDIINVETRKTSGLTDNGIRITTKDSKSYDFVVNDRDQWMFILKKKI